MKKAIAAGALLLLLLAASLWNIRFLDGVTRELTDRAERCRSFCRTGDFPSAEAELTAAANRWEQIGAYAHIFLRQTETDEVEAGLRDVLECLRTGDSAAAEVAITALERRLSGMTAMEHITWESIL